MKINHVGDNPYAEIISRYYLQSFPEIVNFSNKDLLEILTDIIVGTKEIRYTARPGVESLFQIRKVIKDSLDKREAIPILMPWGGRKLDPDTTIDVAEIAGLQRLVNLNNSVKRFYDRGLNISVRVEDTGAKWLYRNQNHVGQDVERYTSDFLKLVDIIAHGIHAVPESSVMNHDEYFNLSKEISKYMYNYLVYSDVHPLLSSTSKEFQAIKNFGWTGIIPKEQRDYYRQRYHTNYPGISNEKATEYLADYLAGSLARYKLNGRLEPMSTVKGYLQATFAHPIPSAPESMFSTTLYYRTIDASNGRTHVSPWRGKGYLKISDSSSKAIPKVVSFHDDIVNHLIPHTFSLENDTVSVEIKSDYLIT